MTNKERKINERNISIVDNFYKLYDERNNVLVENYNPETVGSYGRITNMSATYKLAKKLYLAEYGEWGEVYLTTGEIVPSLDISRNCEVYSYVKKSDIQEIWKKRYVVLKRGGVFDLFSGYWFKRKDFFDSRETYNKNLRYYKAKINSHRKFIDLAKKHIDNWLVDKITAINPDIKYTFDDMVLYKMAEELNDNINVSDDKFISALISALISTDAKGSFGMNSISVVDDTFKYSLWDVLYDIEDSVRGYSALDQMNDLIDRLGDQ